MFWAPVRGTHIVVPMRGIVCRNMAARSRIEVGGISVMMTSRASLNQSLPTA